MQLEQGDLWPHVESNLEHVTDASADVERPASIECELARGVSPILDRKKRRRQERSLALATVCVAAQNPAVEAFPPVEIDRVRIVAEGHSGTTRVQRSKRLPRIEATGPQVVHACDLQLANFTHLIAQNRDAGITKDPDQARGNLRVAPARAIVMVSQDTERTKPSMRSAFIDSLHVLVESPLVAGEVAGVDDDVRSQIPDSGERLEDIAVIDLRADVKIAQLHKRAPVEVDGQAFDREDLPNDLEPVRLDLPHVATKRQAGRRE